MLIQPSAEVIQFRSLFEVKLVSAGSCLELRMPSDFVFGFRIAQVRDAEQHVKNLVRAPALDRRRVLMSAHAVWCHGIRAEDEYCIFVGRLWNERAVCRNDELKPWELCGQPEADLPLPNRM